MEEGSTYALPNRRVRVYIYSNGEGEQPSQLAEAVAQIISSSTND